jgi:hypothetical protein
MDEVMILLGMVYPYFWAMNGKEVEKKLHIHLNVLRVTFNVPCKVISESIFFFLHYSQIKQIFQV